MVAGVAVIAHPRQFVPRTCASAAQRGGRASACGAGFVAHPECRGDLLRFVGTLLFVPPAELQNAHLQQMRAGALQIDAKHWIGLPNLWPLCLPLVISHYSFLLPRILLHTIALP